ncbi:MAG: SoxR reducing system RseC family protein [Candidatus Omnitrophica bacterium]|nr:SoxR reducing system RseC family protein [Candidatus Omnitrophota bacterium]MCM8769206.1 SoxR reducing system RseC family protein [Candidatus Omnitrophota bacterium]
MQEKGTIIEEKDNLVVVKLDREKSAGCAGCGRCHSGSDGRLLVEAEKYPGAEIGQRVLIEILPQEVLVSCLLIYGLPLAGFILGVIASRVFESNLGKTIVFLGCFGLSWWAGLSLGQRYGQKHRPKIVKTLP